MNHTNNFGRSLLDELKHRYVPYWPVFVILLALSLTAAFLYLRYTSPVYESTASIVIKDETKGVDDPRMTESINMFNSKKIVENEIEVIQSRALMKQVVEELGLYAIVFEEGKVKPVSAYLSSPVQIYLRQPYNLPVGAEEYLNVSLSYDSGSQKVMLGQQVYDLNEWVQTPYGELKFIPNPNKRYDASSTLFVDFVHPQLITNAILESLEVSPASKLSSVVNLKLKDHVAKRGEDILNQLIHTYHQSAILDRNALATSTVSFIEERMRFVEKELEILESQVQQYKSKKGIVDLSEQGKVYLQHAGDNARKIEELDIQLAVLEKVERYVIAREQTSSIVPATLGVNDPVLAQLLQKLYDSEIQYQRLRKTTGENNPILTSVSDEIAKIRPSILDNIRSQRENLQATKINLVSSRGQYKSALQNIPENERELLEISRQQAIKNSIYSFLLQKREEAALSYSPSAADGKLVDKAESSLWPVSPKPKMIYLIAVAFAIAMGIGITTGKDLLSSKVMYRSEVEGFTSAPVVAELTSVKRGKGQPFQKPEPYVIEQFRQMRTTLGLYGRTFQKRKILVTSSIPGEGKSFVSSNLAYSLAMSGKKVALLDLDLRNPNTTNLFNQVQQTGITDYLNEDLAVGDIIIKSEHDNLWLIPAGHSIGDNTEQLLNGRLEILFEYLVNEFDYLIIDSPPVELVTDAFLLSEFCDMTLFVIRHAYTPKTVAQRLEHTLQSKPLKNLAVVFNGVKNRGFIKKNYGYGYGYSNEKLYTEKYLHRKA